MRATFTRPRRKRFSVIIRLFLAVSMLVGAVIVGYYWKKGTFYLDERLNIQLRTTENLMKDVAYLLKMSSHSNPPKPEWLDRIFDEKFFDVPHPISKVKEEYKNLGDLAKKQGVEEDFQNLFNQWLTYKFGIDRLNSIEETSSNGSVTITVKHPSIKEKINIKSEVDWILLGEPYLEKPIRIPRPNGFNLSTTVSDNGSVLLTFKRDDREKQHL